MRKTVVSVLSGNNNQFPESGEKWLWLILIFLLAVVVLVLMRKSAFPPNQPFFTFLFWRFLKYFKNYFFEAKT